MGAMSPVPAWPVIIKHEGDDELSYVESEAAWLADTSLSASPCEAGDFMVDTNGLVFELRYNAERHRVEPVDTGSKLPLERFSNLVQLHLAVLAQCCISKLAFSSYQQGLEMVAKTDA
jgi:hypothetical protein